VRWCRCPAGEARCRYPNRIQILGVPACGRDAVGDGAWPRGPPRATMNSVVQIKTEEEDDETWDVGEEQEITVEDLTSLRVYVRNDQAKVRPCNGAKCHGKVVWWNHKQGVGAIRVHRDHCQRCGGPCEGIPESVKVLRSAVRSRHGTYPRLYATEEVEFGLRESEGGCIFARNVTGRGGKYVKGNPSTDLRVYTAGACIGVHPGQGGWAFCAEVTAACGDSALARPESKLEEEFQGSNREYYTTHAAMEVMAALEGVRWAIREGLWGKLEIVSDSADLISWALDGERMRTRWSQNEWMNVPQNLWRSLYKACHEHGGVTFANVGTHSDNTGNDLATSLARIEAESARIQSHSRPPFYAQHSAVPEEREPPRKRSTCGTYWYQRTTSTTA